jgi:hypothetical protein
MTAQPAANAAPALAVGTSVNINSHAVAEEDEDDGISLLGNPPIRLCHGVRPQWQLTEEQRKMVLSLPYM